MDNFFKDPNGYNRFHANGRPKVTLEINERTIVRVVKKFGPPLSNNGFKHYWADKCIQNYSTYSK